MILSFWSTFLQAGRNFFDPVAIRCQDLPRFNPPVGEINPRSLTFWISIRAAVNLGRSLHSLPISHAAVHQEASYSRSTIIGASLSLLWTKDKYFSRNILVRFVKRDILTRVRIRSEGKSWDDGSFEFDVDLPFNRRGSHNAGRNYVTLINPPLSLSLSTLLSPFANAPSSFNSKGTSPSMKRKWVTLLPFAQDFTVNLRIPPLLLASARRSPTIHQPRPISRSVR